MSVQFNARIVNASPERGLSMGGFQQPVKACKIIITVRIHVIKFKKNVEKNQFVNSQMTEEEYL